MHEVREIDRIPYSRKHEIKGKQNKIIDEA